MIRDYHDRWTFIHRCIIIHDDFSKIRLARYSFDSIYWMREDADCSFLNWPATAWMNIEFNEATKIKVARSEISIRDDFIRDPVVRGYATFAKTNRPDVKMPLCERSRFIRPHQDTPSSIIRHYISRYSTTQFHWIYPSAEDKKKKKKRKQVGEEKRERKFWPLIGLNRIAVALLELGDWKLGSRQTTRREDTFVAISLSRFLSFFFLLPLLFPSLPPPFFIAYL